MNDLYENINEHNYARKRKIFVVFHNMIPNVMTNKKFKTIIKNYLLDADN